MHLDHVVIRVDHLEPAVALFIEQGFKVTMGGEHSGGLTENALIHFADGTYLELLHFKKPLSAQLLWRSGLAKLLLANGAHHLRYRFVQLIGMAPGLADAALLCPDLPAFCRSLSSADLPHAPAADFGRQAPDGTRYVWQIACSIEPGLPFAMSEFSPPRQISEALTQHPNGITGIKTLHYAVSASTERQQPWRILEPAHWTETEDGDRNDKLALVYHAVSKQPEWEKWVHASRNKPVRLELSIARADSQSSLSLPPHWHGDIRLVPER